MRGVCIVVPLSLLKQVLELAHEEHQVNYRKVDNQIKECTSARWRYMNTNPKHFWNYVKSKRKGSSDLVSLKVKDEFLNDDISTFVLQTT